MSAPLTPIPPACPYPGLRPFETAEAHLFFGRARQVGDMLTRLETRRLLAVVGVSGCGKSSLVRAGLIPALREGWLASRATDWRIAVMRPGSDPFAAIADALLAPEALGAERCGPTHAAAFLEAALRRGRLGLGEVVAETPLPPETGLMLVVDQFEEVFRFRTEGADPARARDDADAFAQFLLASTRPPDATQPPLLVVLTMRSDFLGDCAVFAGLPEAINDAQLLTPRLTRAQYEEAIREPARLWDGDLAPNLVARLLNDMGEDPDRLPVLQHALMRMWTRAAERPGWDRQLRMSDYPGGGLNAALSAHCDEVFFELAQGPQRRLAKILFQALCERSGTRRDTRRPQRIAAVASVAGVDAAALYPIVSAFRAPDRCFLVASPPGEPTPDTVLDIGHESLIAHWQRLALWVEDESDSANDYRDLSDRARRHAAGEGDPLAGQDLERLLAWKAAQRPTSAWARRYGGGCRQALAFLERSRREWEAEQERRRRADQEREAARERELAAARQRELAAADALAQQTARSTRNLRIWLALSALMLLAAIAAALWAVDRAQVALDQRKSALESRAKWFTEYATHNKLEQPQLSLLLALEANRAAPDLADSETGLRAVLADIGGSPLPGFEAAIGAVAISPDGRLLASGSEDNRVRLSDLTDPEAKPTLLRGHLGPVLALAFSSDGRILASGSEDYSVRLWDLSDLGAEPRILRGHPSIVHSLAFSPDGRTLASVCGDDKLRLWDLSDPEAGPRISPGQARWLNSVAFAPDGRTIASGYGDGPVRLWDLTDPMAEPRELDTHASSVSSIAFSPDGNTLALGAGDNMENRVRLLDLSHPDAEPRDLGEHREPISSVAFAPDGRTIASGSWDRTVRLWPLRDPDAEPRVLHGHEGWVTSVAFTPDGKGIASGSRDKTIRLWDLTDSQAEPRIMRGQGRWGSIFALAPDWRTLASAPGGSDIRIWDLGDPNADPRILSGQHGIVSALAFVPDGRMLSSGSDDRAIRLWDLTDPEGAPLALRGHEDTVGPIAFSKDGRRLASASRDGTVRLWDLAQPEVSARVLAGPQDPVIYDLAFSPDGHKLAGGSSSYRVRIWDLKDPEAEPRVLNGDQGPPWRWWPSPPTGACSRSARGTTRCDSWT